MREHDALEHNPQVSRKALEALHSQLFGWALSRCGFDESAAEDLMQQAYVEVLSGRARFDNRSTLKTFVFGVVQNLARSRFRRLAVHMRLVRTYAVSPIEDTASDLKEDHREQQRIWQAVESLPRRQRDITELVFCRDMTIEAASAVMGVSIGTGRVHYDRAKKALAGALAGLQLEGSSK
jgi:RNA polymerase sigma-70 factor (ECF subfamily)